MNDLELFLQDKPGCGLTMKDICLIILLFADDMVILGNSVEDLQTRLDLLYEYCTKWGLEVNTDKTKIVVFRNKGPIKRNETWKYGEKSLDIVDNFNYLGVVFNYTGSFVLNSQYIHGKAIKALNVLINNMIKYDVQPKIALQLFDAFVGSTLNYACPVWGFNKYNDLERIHLRFCKFVLGVRQNACNAAVYGELGRYPLYIHRYIQILKYWFKVKDSSNIILKTMYQVSKNRCEKGYKSWALSVKQILDEHGFSHVWISPWLYNENTFIPTFKQKVYDCFLQKWRSDINNSSILNIVYSHLHEQFIMSKYLTVLKSKTYRSYLARIRISAHHLRVQTGRYGQNRIPRNERSCLLCGSSEVEDEFHFILICPRFADLRRKYIDLYYSKKPSMYKLITLLNQDNKQLLLNLCNYLKFAQTRRNNFLGTLT
ncbi:hypothetical protein ACF0H5_002452 [Mactra antiquata]